MGKKGREIVQSKLDVNGLIEDLQHAYADEWLAHYYYLLATNLAAGLNADAVANRLRSQANDELGHAHRIAQRIIQLGGDLPRDFAQLPRLANCKTFVMPENPADLKGIINAVLAAERCAIDVYLALAEKTRHADPVTHELAESLLADEVDDEEEFENLLAQ
ncbi:MAG: ferritin [Chloroflexi bacterium]|nr:ferritin [Chloroflexota bacterium]